MTILNSALRIIHFFCVEMEGAEILNYELPDHKIAKHPLTKRDTSKQLIYKEGKISDHRFHELPDHLPSGSRLFFNDTKVIPARLHFFKTTGALIECFLLEPIAPSNIVSQAMEETGKVTWKCMVGNFKKWKNDITLESTLEVSNSKIILKAFIEDRDSQLISFEWNTEHSFAEIVELAGQVPLPPYLNREVEFEDAERYQTVYSHNNGAVAAPTAGLHFTDEVLNALSTKGIKQSFLTLHVSAGTFQPIKVDDPTDHPMHSEQMVVTRQVIEDVLSTEKVIAVGTTSMRTLESLFWFGRRILNENTDFNISKLEIYETDRVPSRKEAFEAILKWMKAHKKTVILGSTEIFIMGNYEFKVCDGLVTNFHQPGSTLLMLINAFVKGDWKNIYDHALSNNYRFLSYGDSSLLMP